MAEIRIEKKKPIWPWILLVLIILAAIYFFWYYNDKKMNADDDLIDNDTISQVDENYRYEERKVEDTTYLYSGNYGKIQKEQSFSDYFGFVDNMDNKTSDRNYYRTAFFKLITATKREAEIKNVDVSSNISAAMESAEKMTNDPTISKNSNDVKKAAEEVAKALRTIQEKSFNNLSDGVKELDTAISGIDGSKTLDTQATNIDAFFDKTARLLQRMYENDNNN